MGILSRLGGAGKAHNKFTSPAQRQVEQGRALWRQALGRAKEDQSPTFPNVRNRRGWAASAIAGDPAFKRLLQAMRSMAPGGWSDDRFEQSKHESGIVYPAIHRKGEQLSMAEFQVFKKDHRHQDGKRPISPKDPPEGGRPLPPYKLVELLEGPNNDDGFGDLIYQWCQQMDLTGMALTWMVPNALGIPHELYVIPTAIAIPQPAINPDYPDGFYRIQPIYPYGPFSSYPTPATAVGAPIPAQWMLRFKYPHPLLRYEGYSPMTALRLHIDEIEAMDRSRWYSINRLVNPSAVLNFDEMDGAEPMPEAEIERVRAEFENSFQGPENAGRLFVSAPGSKLEIQEARLKDMEFKDGWDQLVSFVLGAGFGITKPAAGMVEDSSYSTLFATLKQLHLLTLDPFCKRIARYLTRHLAPFFGDDLIVEIKCARIDDHDLRNARLQLAMQAKAITKNQILQELDMAVTQEEWGNEIAGTEPVPPGMEGQPGMPQAGGAVQPPNLPPQPAPQAPGIPGLPANVTGGAEGSPKPEQAAGPQASLPSEVRAQPPEEQQGRPQAGKLGRGALGPRKDLEPAEPAHRLNGHFKALRNKYGKTVRRNGVRK